MTGLTGRGPTGTSPPRAPAPLRPPFRPLPPMLLTSLVATAGPTSPRVPPTLVVRAPPAEERQKG